MPSKEPHASQGYKEKDKSKLILFETAYRAIIISCTRFANQRIPKDEWREVYGLMIGYTDKKKNVVCTECVPMTHTRDIGHILKVQFEEQDYADAVMIEDEAFTRDPPQFIVGWFHSHPGIKIMFSQDDIKTQLGWQTNNPLALGLVFNPTRLVQQKEVAYKKGDPDTLLEDDPGFEVFRLDDPSGGIKASYHNIHYEIVTDGKKKLEKPWKQLLLEAQNLVQDTTNLLPRENVLGTLENFVDKSVETLSSALSGLEEYARTLVRKGQANRIREVVETQRSDIEEIIKNRTQTLVKMRDIFNFIEYKDRETIIPQIEPIVQRWSSLVASVDGRLAAITSENFS
ncbi:MAG: hypothetical protein ACTSU5_16930 [Promethearchaeota archaeon]